MKKQVTEGDDILERVYHSYATKDDIENPDWSEAVYRGQIKRCSVADLILWCHEHELDPASVEIAGGGIRYRKREAAAERQSRLDSVAKRDARNEQWERETYERLRAKFEQPCQLETHVRCHHPQPEGEQSAVSYNDPWPCANDPTHGPASVGISTTGVEAKWVCIPCFEQYLAEKRLLIEKLTRKETDDRPEGCGDSP